VVETTAPDAVRAAFDGVAPVRDLGRATGRGRLDLSVGERDLRYDHAAIRDRRAALARELD
jgi:phosphoribosylformylglycinamidine synthase